MPFCEKEVLFDAEMCSQDISQNEAVQHMESCYLEKVNDSSSPSWQRFSTVQYVSNGILLKECHST